MRLCFQTSEAQGRGTQTRYGADFFWRPPAFAPLLPEHLGAAEPALVLPETFMVTPAAL